MLPQSNMVMCIDNDSLTTKKGEGHFTFQYIHEPRWGIENKTTQNLFKKWSLDETMKLKKYSFDEYFQAFQIDQFIMDFFNDPNVLTTFENMSKSSNWSNLSSPIVAVEADEVKCSLTNLSILDRLYSRGIIRESGAIVKCFDDFVSGFTISDELRNVLLTECSENYNIFAAEEREELLLRMLTHFVLGGSVCQYEDDFKPYLETLRQFYKDFVSVAKDPQTQKLLITSHVYAIKSVDSLTSLFPTSTDEQAEYQNFCYISIDPVGRTVRVCYNAWTGL